MSFKLNKLTETFFDLSITRWLTDSGGLFIGGIARENRKQIRLRDNVRAVLVGMPVVASCLFAMGVFELGLLARLRMKDRGAYQLRLLNSLDEYDKDDSEPITYFLLQTVLFWKRKELERLKLLK